MSTPNIILIKRRLANSPLGITTLPLTGGELGFNEVNNTLYYGSSAGVIDIAGPGSYTRLTLTNTLTSDLQNQLNLLSSNTNTEITKYLPLSGGTVDGAVTIKDSLTVYGSFSATGYSYFANTIYSTTSSLSVVNIGNTGPALYVGNNGTGDLASFYDIDSNKEIFHIGGANGDYPNVGVKTSTPNADLTVYGDISASGTIYTNNLATQLGLSASSITLLNNKLVIDSNGNLTTYGTISGDGLHYISNFIIDGGLI